MDLYLNRFPLIVIIGPTAVGKTAFSLQLAKKIHGEIISADSRLFYRGMDIGTDKPSSEIRSKVTHHLIDICEPNETLTLGQYQRLASDIINDLHSRERIPILVGGTGQYIQAIVEGWGIPRVPPQPLLRAALENLGQSELKRWLSVLDPVSAARIDSRNVRRLVRALEVTLKAGRPFSEIQRKRPPEYPIKIIGLTCTREILYERIDERVDRMIQLGLIDEVKRLIGLGYQCDLPAMSGLGYRQLCDHLAGMYTLLEAIERIKFETHRFVRQQYTWFRLDDPSVTWFDIQADKWLNQANNQIFDWLTALRILRLEK